MKRYLTFFMILVLALVSCTPKNEAKVAAAPEAAASVDPVMEAAEAYFADYPGSRIIPASKVFEMMDAEEDFFLLDIRQADVYAAGHLKGAVNAPWGSEELADAVNWLPDDVPVYVNCYTGQTAGQTTSVLNVAGFQVNSIKYGWNLGISKTEGFENYVETKASLAPDASGVKIDPAVKTAAVDYFSNLKSDPEAPNNIIPSAKLKEKLDAEDEMVIVSIRQPDAYTEGHIEGAINIPFEAGMQEAFADLPRDEKVFVYCYSGQTAGQTVGIMRLMGIDAASVKSGMGTPVTGESGWGNEGFPVVQ